MLHRAARTRTVVLLDFLAPGLLSRVASSAVPSGLQNPIRNHNTFPLHSKDTAKFFEKLKKRITVIHSTNGRDISDRKADIFNSTVIRIRQALKDKNVDAIWEYWQYLEQNRLLHFLGPSQLERISGLIAASFFPAHGHSEPWNLAERKAVEEIALGAAAGGATDALNACMIARIKRNEPKAVIELYRRLMKLLKGKESWEDADSIDKDQTDPSGLALASTPSPDSIFHTPGRVSLLLAVITAHAMQDSFQGALQTSLETVIRFQRYTTKGFLQKIDHDPTLQQKVETYVQRLDVARLVARSRSFSKQITNLSETQAVKPLEKLYQAVIDGLSGPDAYLATDLTEVTPNRSVALTDVGWASFLVAFLKCRRRDLAGKIWNDMARFGIRPGVSMWTAILDAYDSIGASDEAVAGWNIMLSQGIQPEGLTYRALISTLFNALKPDEALQRFQTFQKEFMKNCPPVQTLSVYNTVLNGLLATHRVDEATTLLQEMQAKGPTPDVVSYNTFLAYYGRRGDLKTLAVLVNKMTSLGLVGDVFSFSTILSALLKIGRDDAPEMMLRLMRRQGVQPNVATYSAIIDQQMRERDERNLRAAMHMLQQMEQDPNAQPNEVTYTSILAGIYRGQWLPPSAAEEWRRDIVERMKKRGVKLNRVTYHILFKACLEYEQPEGLQHALVYYREMVRRKIPMVQTTWYILLAGLLQRGEWGVANEIVSDMFKSGTQPGVGVLELVSRIRKRTKQRIRPGPRVYF